MGLSKHHKKGFTLVEIMIVTAVIGMLAAIAVPSILKAWRTSQASRFASDLRIVTAAFDEFATAIGYYPSNEAVGVEPADIAPYLKSFRWDQPAIGGQWDWGVTGITAAISIVNPAASSNLMVSIDERVDDGDLASGRFTTGASNSYVYVIEQ